MEGLGIISTSARPVIAYEKLPATFERDSERGFDMARNKKQQQSSRKEEEQEQQQGRLR